MWVFGYGSLIWKPGFHYDDCLVGFIKGYRRVFYQGSTDHRGTPEFPGRTVTLETADGEIEEVKSPIYNQRLITHLSRIRALYVYNITWGIAYKITKKEDQEVAITYLEVREKQYDKKAYLDFFTDLKASTPAISDVLVKLISLFRYVASPDKTINKNYLGPASIEEIASQIVRAEGPSGPNRDYLFQLEKALGLLGKVFYQH
nr:gamma-glutamylcyclotransferase 2-3 [Ipomoea batatas]